MSLISLAQGLSHAREHGYALGAFNVLDTHFLRALFAAAEAQRAMTALALLPNNDYSASLLQLVVQLLERRT